MASRGSTYQQQRNTIDLIVVDQIVERVKLMTKRIGVGWCKGPAEERGGGQGAGFVLHICLPVSKLLLTACHST